MLDSIIHIGRGIAFIVMLFPSFSHVVSAQSLQLHSIVDSTDLSYCYLVQHNQVIGLTINDSVRWYRQPTVGSALLLYCHGYDTLTITYPFPDTILKLAPLSVSLSPVQVKGCRMPFKLGATKGRLQRKVGIQMADLSQHVRFLSNNGLPEGCNLDNIAIYMPRIAEEPGATLRLLIYQSQADTFLPGENVLLGSIVLSVQNDGNWYSADISAYSLQLMQPLFVGWEVLEVEEGEQPIFGVMWEKTSMGSFSWDIAHQFWRFIGDAKLETEKYKPNIAIRLTVQCPCKYE